MPFDVSPFPPSPPCYTSVYNLYYASWPIHPLGAMLSRKFAIRTVSKALLILSSLIGWDIRFKVASGALAPENCLPRERIFIVRMRETTGREEREEWATGRIGEGEWANFDRGAVQKEVAVRMRYVTQRREGRFMLIRNYRLGPQPFVTH